MPNCLILLGPIPLIRDVASVLDEGAGGARLVRAADLSALEARLGETDDARVLAYGFGERVPARLLAQAGAGAYNLHPGPPEYPGLFPSCFALYEGAREFGVTLHAMTEELDSGPVIAVERFALSPDMDRLALDTACHQAVLRLVGSMAAMLLRRPEPLPASGDRWSGARRTRADFEALCELPDTVDEAEFARRYRAVGEGPHHALSIRLFGHRFRLDNRRAHEAVVRAGRPEAD